MKIQNKEGEERKTQVDRDTFLKSKKEVCMKTRGTGLHPVATKNLRRWDSPITLVWVIDKGCPLSYRTTGDDDMILESSKF